MNVSVIIPTYNNERTIGLVLEALKNQEYQRGQVEFIVIDDGSKDSTIKICEAHGVSVIKNEKNLGLAYTLNRGIKLSKNEIIVTLHGDTIPILSRWLSELIEPLDNPSVAASCSLQQPPTYNRGNLSMWEKLLWAKLDEHNALNNKADAYRKEIFTEIGFFDDKTFRTAGEDEDMALRQRFNNKRIVGTLARVHHKHFFACSSSQCVVDILKKEYIFGQAGGALRRKFLFYKPGAYVFPNPKGFMYDGLFRVMMCIGSLIPYIQVIFIPMFILSCFLGICKTIKYVGSINVVFLYPIFNLLRFWSYTFGYIHGIVTKKQR